MADEKKPKLTDYQRAFLVAYLPLILTGHGAIKKAAEVSGVNYDYCRKMVTLPHIQAEITRLIDVETEKSMLKYGNLKRRIILELSRIAFADCAEIYDKDGDLLPLDKMSEDARRTIIGIKKKISMKDGISVDIKQVDPKGALDSLARIEGMFNDKIEVHAFGDILKEISDMGGAAESLVKE